MKSKVSEIPAKLDEGDKAGFRKKVLEVLSSSDLPQNVKDVLDTYLVTPSKDRKTARFPIYFLDKDGKYRTTIAGDAS